MGDLAVSAVDPAGLQFGVTSPYDFLFTSLYSLVMASSRSALEATA